MDRRTVYLQELTQVSDFLVMQRNMLKGLGAMTFGLFGNNTVAMTLPTSTTGTQLTNALATASGMNIVVPPMSIYQLAQADDSVWSTLGADTTPILQQGLNWSSVQKLVTLTTTTGQVQSFLLEGAIDVATDQNNVVLPYYPLIQTSTTAYTHTTTKVWVSSTQGMTVGDEVVIQGNSASGGGPILIATIGSDGNGPFITVNTLSSAPSSAGGTVVRDVNPNGGAPLNGMGNNGVAQPMDRVFPVKFKVLAGSAASGSSTVPSAETGWIPLYAITNVPHGSSSITGYISLAANAPFFAGLVNAHHHRKAGAAAPSVGSGYGGNAAPIHFSTEAEYVPVNTAGDTMSGPLNLNVLNFIAKGSMQGLAANAINAYSNYNSTSTSIIDSSKSAWALSLGSLADQFTIYRSRGLSGFPSWSSVLELITTNGATSNITEALTKLYLLGRVVPRIVSGEYTGDNTASRFISTGISPSIVLLFPRLTAVNTDTLLIATPVWQYGLYRDDTIDGIGLNSAQGSSSITLTNGGFNTPPLISGVYHYNVAGLPYAWIALG